MSDGSTLFKRTWWLFPLLALVTLLAFGGVKTYDKARATAVHAYLESVCHAVEDFKSRNGEYPARLEQIDTSSLDYDVGIPLYALEYDVDESGVRVAYTGESGEVIRCERSAAAE